MTSRHRLPLDEVNLFSTLGIELVEQSPERVVATMSFDERVSQLTGLTVTPYFCSALAHERAKE